MSQAEDPKRLSTDHTVTLEDVQALMGASTPHFAMQIRVRLKRLIAGLPADHPARIEGEREIRRLDQIAYAGEVRGDEPEEGLPTLRSVIATEVAAAPAQH
ncbi:MAG TPA: hypothetical protein VME01_02105 [Solirubrobacteraceae bacterium]|nr:hypothetical protein [Solirubrobacteraceae bacterium]